MKQSLILLVTIFILSTSCKHSTDEENIQKQLSILNNSFLNIVDTLAYKYHTLRPAVSEPIVDTPAVLPITLYQNLTSLKHWKPSILICLADIKDPELSNAYTAMLMTEKDLLVEQKIDFKQLQLTGRYTLVPTNNAEEYKRKGMIGHLKFSKILFNKNFDKALLVATIKDNVKDGIVKLILLQKQNNNWEKFKEETLEIW